MVKTALVLLGLLLSSVGASAKDFVGIIRTGDTVSAWALKVTRKAANWRDPGVKVEYQDRLIPKNRYRHIPAGSVITISESLVRTEPYTLTGQSIRDVCRQKYTDPDCAQRLSKINGIYNPDLQLTSEIIYIPKDFVPLPRVTAERTPAPPATESPQPLARPPTPINWWIVFWIVAAVLLVAALAMTYSDWSKREFWDRFWDRFRSNKPSAARPPRYTVTPPPFDLSLDQQEILNNLASEVETVLKARTEIPIIGLHVKSGDRVPLLHFFCDDESRPVLKTELVKLIPKYYDLGARVVRTEYANENLQETWEVPKLDHYSPRDPAATERTLA